MVDKIGIIIPRLLALFDKKTSFDRGKKDYTTSLLEIGDNLTPMENHWSTLLENTPLTCVIRVEFYLKNPAKVPGVKLVHL